jgi:rRNA small subunit pseudouridine methyltransferase Nep1
VQLLHKYNVRASDGPMKLLKVIKNPITDHLPVGCKKIAMSFSSNSMKHPRDFVPENEPIAIIVGAMAHGQVGFVLTLQ